MLLVYEQSNIQFIVSDREWLFAQKKCIKIHWFCLSKLAAVSSEQWEQWLYTGLMGNAKVEYHLRIQCYCLQWLNVTHMDENSFWNVYLYRLYFIMLYWDPDYTNKQRDKAGIITKTHVRSLATVLRVSSTTLEDRDQNSLTFLESVAFSFIFC